MENDIEFLVDLEIRVMTSGPRFPAKTVRLIHGISLPFAPSKLTVLAFAGGIEVRVQEVRVTLSEGERPSFGVASLKCFETATPEALESMVAAFKSVGFIVP